MMRIMAYDERIIYIWRNNREKCLELQNRIIGKKISILGSGLMHATVTVPHADIHHKVTLQVVLCH